jgi:hypothetical protein
MLDDPILPRMVGNDGEHSARAQAVAQRRKSALETGKFVIDGDPQRLE